MSAVLQFPNPMEEARRRAEEFQRKSADERWREIIAMMAFGLELVRTSPNREIALRLMDEDEAQWRRIQQELFTHYGG